MTEWGSSTVQPKPDACDGEQWSLGRSGLTSATTLLLSVLVSLLGS